MQYVLIYLAIGVIFSMIFELLELSVNKKREKLGMTKEDPKTKTLRRIVIGIVFWPLSCVAFAAGCFEGLTKKGE